MYNYPFHVSQQLCYSYVATTLGVITVRLTMRTHISHCSNSEVVTDNRQTNAHFICGLGEGDLFHDTFTDFRVV